FAADSSTADTQTDANIRGRQSMLRMLRFVRTLPGCEDTRLDRMCSFTAVRETYRILGDYEVSYEDYLGGIRFPDTVCNTYYFVDVHHEDGAHHEFIPGDLVPTIPLRALTPRGSKHLLVAGRCVAAERRAHSG